MRQKRKLIFICSFCLLLICIFSGMVFQVEASSQSVGVNISKWMLDESNGYIYAISRDSNKLLFIRSGDLQIEATLDINAPYDMEIYNGKIYVTTTNNNQIGVFDIAAKQLEKYLITAYYAFSIAIEGEKLYYCNLDQVYVYNLTNGTEELIPGSRNYGADICLDSQNHVLYIGDMGSSGSKMQAIRATDYTQLTKTTYDYGYGFPYASGDLIFDGSSVYYYSSMGTNRLNGNNLAEIYGYYPEKVLYVKGNYVFSGKTVYDRDLFVKIIDLPMTVTNVLMDNADNVYMFESGTKTIYKQILDLNPDRSMRHQNSEHKVVLDETLADWVYDEGANRIYAISATYNKLLYIRASDLVVESEKYIGSQPVSIRLYNGNLYIALYGATRIAVTGVDPASGISIIPTTYNPNSVDAGPSKLYYSEGHEWCRVAVYNFTTQQTQLIGHPNGEYFYPGVLYNQSSDLFYIGEFGLTSGTIFAIRNSDYVTIGQYDYNQPNGKIIMDQGYLYYAGNRIDPNNLSNSMGVYGNTVIATQGLDIYTSSAVYNRDTLQKMCDLPYSTKLAAESSTGVVYLYDDSKMTINKYDNLEQVYIPLYITLDSYAYSLQVNSNHITDAYAYFVDRTIRVSSDASYQFSDPTVASVNSYGWVTGLIRGTTSMTVTYRTKTAIAQIRVDNPIYALQFKPTSYTVFEGSVCNTAVTAYYTDGTNADVTNYANYQVNNPAIASVSSSGELTGIKAGNTFITASYLNNSTGAQITVKPVLTSIVPDAAAYSLAAGYTHNTVVTAQYSDGTNTNVTNSAAYQISDPLLASVSAAGVVKGLKAGNVTLTITYGGKSAQVAITVLPPMVTDLSLFPINIDVPLGGIRTFQVTAYYSDSTHSDVTALATYQVSDPQIASAYYNYYGTVKGLTMGSTVLTASYQGKSDTAGITVTEPVFNYFNIDTCAYTLKPGETHNTVVTAVYTDGSTTDITSSATYTISNPQVASVNASGVVTAIAPGETTMTVAYQNSSTEVWITVAQLTFIEGFESNSFTFNGWENSGAEIQSAYAYSGWYACRLNNSDSIIKSLSTLGYSNITVTYARMTQSFKTTQHLYVEWYNGTSWVLIEDVKGNSSWAWKSWTLPSGANNNANFKIRFRTNVTSSNYAYIDDVEISSVM